MTSTNTREDSELQEVLRRSREETNIEDALLAQALAASLSTRDEELARSLQIEQYRLLEQRLMQGGNVDSLSNAAGPSTTHARQTQPTRFFNTPPSNSPRAFSYRSSSSPHVSHQTSPSTHLSQHGSPSCYREARNRDLPIFRDDEYGQLPSAASLEGKNWGTSDESSGSDLRRRTSFSDIPLLTATKTQDALSVSSADSLDRDDKYEQQKIRTPFSSTFLPPNIEKRSASSTLPNAMKNQISFEYPQPPTSSQVGEKKDEKREESSRKSPSLSSNVSLFSRRYSKEPVVVIDGQNVACSYGGGKDRFKSKGIEVVLDYYLTKGMEAVAMIPACKADDRPGINNDRLADDPALLRNLAGKGRISFTPAGSHDDNFLLAYAKRKNIDIISNDRFQKEVKAQATESASQELQKFLDAHLIPYTFVRGEFMPNPDPTQLSAAKHCSRKTTRRRR